MIDIKVMTSAELSAFLLLLKAADEVNRLPCGELSDIDRAKEDVLHYIELENPDINEKAEAAEVLHGILKIRREIKDAQEMISPVSKWVSENKAVIKSLERMLGELRSVEERHRVRVYSPRTEVFDSLKKRFTEGKDTEGGV